MAYSVPSRPRRSHSGRPNPTENRRTLTPNRRATQKCPNSWNVTSTPRLTIIHHTDPTKLFMAVTHPAGEQTRRHAGRRRGVGHGAVPAHRQTATHRASRPHGRG